MSANAGKAARPDRAGRKVASGLAGVGSAAAIVGAGVAAALHGQPIAPEQDAGVQQAALTATVSPIPTPASSPSTPIVGPGTPTNNAFGFSGQVGVNLPQAFPSLFGTGQAGFNPGGVSTILNVSPPTDSRIAGFLPLNNVQNVFGSLFSPPVNTGQPSLPSAAPATNFIDPQPQFVNPDLVNLQNGLANFVAGNSPANQALISQAANQVSSNLQTIDGIFQNLQNNAAQPIDLFSPIPQATTFPLLQNTPAQPASVLSPESLTNDFPSSLAPLSLTPAAADQFYNLFPAVFPPAGTIPDAGTPAGGSVPGQQGPTTANLAMADPGTMPDAANGLVTRGLTPSSGTPDGTAAPTAADPTAAPAAPAPTDTAAAAPTDTAVASATAAPVAAPVDTAAAAPTDTAVASTTAAPVAAPVDTAAAAPTDTAVASTTAAPAPPMTSSDPTQYLVSNGASVGGGSPSLGSG